MKDHYDIVWNDSYNRYEARHIKTRSNGALLVVLDVPGYSEACKIARHEHPRISLPKYPVILGEPMRWEGRAR